MDVAEGERLSVEPKIQTNQTLNDPSLRVMNFLNEIVLEFPAAISFAPGRPVESLFNVESSLLEIQRYVDHRVAETGQSRAKIFESLGQYGKTKGIVSDLVARQLANDEKIAVDSESILVTSGSQEAMTIALLGLFEPGRDVLLVSEPNYIGITGMAAILGIEVCGVAGGDDGTDPDELEQAICRVRDAGKNPKAFYDIPDFHNPLGSHMPLAARQRLLDIAKRNDLLIIEDNAYGMFAYDSDRIPTLKALDTDGRVIYLGTYSKTLFPGLRVGYLVATDPQLADELSKVKSLTTINTSPILQAIAGGLLLESDCSLVETCRRKVAFYKGNRDRMLECLEATFGTDIALREQVRWNRPAGGFFLNVALPFDFDEEQLRRCARDYRVIVCPMSFFSLDGGRRQQIRLSFSYVPPTEIEEGIRRLFRFVRDVGGA
ncbi:MAG: PLP-dependent aminotransferase family protein [Kofleriaceae bacterium]|nr:PLP-dependent aminotransferase family protein [Kofleriaceae bacterium]